MLGKRDAGDQRNYLWQEYAATILRAQPKYFVVENVAAFAKSQQFRDFSESTQPDGLLGTIRSSGTSSTPQITARSRRASARS